MEITLPGAAGTVTGSRYLVRTEQGSLLVDCGLFPGLKQLRLRNRASFPATPPALPPWCNVEPQARRND